jgi:hypothetical protein
MTIDLGSTATKSITPSLSGDDLNGGGGGACATHITKKQKKNKVKFRINNFVKKQLGARCMNKILTIRSIWNFSSLWFSSSDIVEFLHKTPQIKSEPEFQRLTSEQKIVSEKKR